MRRLQTSFIEYLFGRVIGGQWILLRLDQPCAVELIIDVDEHPLWIVPMVHVLLHHVVYMAVLLGPSADALMHQFIPLRLPEPLLLVSFGLRVWIHTVVAHGRVVVILIGHQGKLLHLVSLHLVAHLIVIDGLIQVVRHQGVNRGLRSIPLVLLSVLHHLSLRKVYRLIQVSCLLLHLTSYLIALEYLRLSSALPLDLKWHVCRQI